ncbi:MAG TPA: hypothetical protein VLD37_02300 [Candidatus Bilamarchaeum sp.]|nr:hypothetical protein [Candidatus Bilamarchaeum sp.]
MRKGRQGKYQTRYKEGSVEVKESGMGKDYDGFRMFHSRKKDEVTCINDDYSEREPTESELARFRKDAAEAARGDRRVGRYLEEFPKLKIRSESEALKMEPEPIAKGS